MERQPGHDLLRSATACALCAASAGAQQLAPREIVSGLSLPLAVVSAPGDASRLYVVEREGKIRVVEQGSLRPEPFLDLTGQVSLEGDGGLLGLAFHPGFAQNGRCFVAYSDTVGDAVVREYSALPSAEALPSQTSKVIFGPYHAGPDHYGLDLQFGPDGMLYVSLGAHTPALAQDLRSYEGKILRLDIDRPPPYVPIDNPYADPQDGYLDLIWARGVRSPWRLAFDRLTGDLWFGDVGDVTREEIDYQEATVGLVGTPEYQGGLDYGWPCYEGTHATGSPACTGGSNGSVAPVFELGVSAKAIIGGRVYRGSAIPELWGRYLCADWGTSEFWSFALSGGVVVDVRDHSSELFVAPGQGIAKPVAFGEDAQGELYVVSFYDGKLWRIERACSLPVQTCQATENSTGQAAGIAWNGSTSVSAGDLVLRADHLPPGTPGFFFHGAQAVQVPLGNGLRCVGGGLVRLPVVHADAAGVAAQPFAAQDHGLQAGATRHFQLYYRDPAAGGEYFNFSDGLRITFCP